MPINAQEFQKYCGEAMGIIAELCECGMEDFLSCPDRGNFYQVENKLWGGLHRYDYSFYSGETRGVIVPDGCDFVIKIPFLDSTEADYCMAEAYNYLKAIEAGLEEHFAWCYYIGEFMGVPIYIMEKADCDEDYISSGIMDTLRDNAEELGCVTSSYYESSSKSSSGCYCVSDYYSYGGADSVSAYLGLSWGDFDEFDRFCDENYINDIHAGNVGYIDDKIVVTDYAGFCCFVSAMERGEISEARYKIVYEAYEEAMAA